MQANICAGFQEDNQSVLFESSLTGNLCSNLASITSVPARLSPIRNLCVTAKAWFMESSNLQNGRRDVTKCLRLFSRTSKTIPWLIGSILVVNKVGAHGFASFLAQPIDSWTSPDISQSFE